MRSHAMTNQQETKTKTTIVDFTSLLVTRTVPLFPDHCLHLEFVLPRSFKPDDSALSFQYLDDWAVFFIQKDTGGFSNDR